MWFKKRLTRISPASAAVSSSQQATLRPWGDDAYLSPVHLPLCIEGDAGVVQRAATRLLLDAQRQGLPIFVQEGPRPVVSRWEALTLPRKAILPPFQAGTTRETIYQTLSEVDEWVTQVDATANSAWPALLVCSSLGAHRDTLLDVARTLKQERKVDLGVIYILNTRQPPLDKAGFAAQLYCQATGKAVLRRHRSHHSVHIHHERASVSVPSSGRTADHKTLA